MSKDLVELHKKFECDRCGTIREEEVEIVDTLYKHKNCGKRVIIYTYWINGVKDDKFY